MRRVEAAELIANVHAACRGSKHENRLKKRAGLSFKVEPGADVSWQHSRDELLLFVLSDDRNNGHTICAESIRGILKSRSDFSWVGPNSGSSPLLFRAIYHEQSTG